MHLNEFITKLYSTTGNYGNVTGVTTYYDKEIIVNEDNEYFVDGVKLDQTFSSLEEAKQYIDIQEDASNVKIDLYETVSNTKVASIIRKYTDEKITNQLIESYIQDASSKRFTIDPIVVEMRSQNTLDCEINGKITFKLNDGKTIAISEQTIETLASTLNKSELKEQTIEFMQESAENFLSVVRLL